jgi:hypothetical protein
MLPIEPEQIASNGNDKPSASLWLVFWILNAETDDAINCLAGSQLAEHGE